MPHLWTSWPGINEFYLRDVAQVLADPVGGIFIPAGAYYRFEAISSEELVLFRVGAKTGTGQDGPSRLNIFGRPMDGHSEENKEVPVIYKDHEFFE